jgi:hypothetical protein
VLTPVTLKVTLGLTLGLTLGSGPPIATQKWMAWAIEATSVNHPAFTEDVDLRSVANFPIST